MSDLTCYECDADLAGTYYPDSYEGSNAGVPGEVELDEDTVEDSMGNLYCNRKCYATHFANIDVPEGCTCKNNGDWCDWCEVYNDYLEGER